jgi:pimeloyl-ACP methyl ester carboxylesterase
MPNSFRTAGNVNFHPRFSLGSQRDLRLEMKNIRAGVLFVSGSRDNKFCELAKIMQENTPRSSLRIFENAGHRVPWDVVDFKNVALEFFNKGDGSESRVDAHKEI